MKKLFFVVIVFCLTMTVYSEVTYMTVWDFQRLVYDFQKDSVWTNKNERPCIIDCYTTWCGPCKKLAPVLAQLSEQYKGKVDFYKVDIEQEGGISKRFNIHSIPTVFYVPVKGEPKITVGVQPKDEICSTIDYFLLKKPLVSK